MFIRSSSSQRPRFALTSGLLILLSVLFTACAAPAAQADIDTEEAGEQIADSVPDAPTAVPTGASVDDEPDPVTDAPEPTTAPAAESSEDDEDAAIAATAQYPADWRDMPVVPEVHPSLLAVYERGQERGRDPHGFSVIGDCQNVSSHFLARFDEEGQYNLGQYDYLRETIDYYSGSYGRERVAVSGGFNVAAVLSPLWNDLEECDDHESPLACEYRINNPSVAIISMETWWYDRPADTYAGYLRQIVEASLEAGIIPILATKADNLEEDHSINAAVVQVAQEYDVPLWNFWRAVQPLPGHGLTEDRFHLTFGLPFFDMEENMNTGWAIRNLTALQSLDAVRRAIEGQPAPPPYERPEF